ncbi:prepilin-type N-terminal cleavage/methylation domain-containing protein [Desulfobotulus sp. H1]|uniref:Type II secretion system protein J n=1 Tax=Desulfobotulus pelophilus TaxID=2823377 RepID=A0ABT3N685_9BACT|nr:prepilin-type N-terminal cleavage/methylation domain-containing protein [Desulfobotulus pelophilus]MCW7752955.1 prepilin-type N-terminal cleavage/methylation domain-containing protein [Desulfobotulus pelophilus]
MKPYGFRRSLSDAVAGKAGFTLMEILVAMVILSIIMGASYASFRAIAGTDQALGPMLKNLEQGRMAMERLSKDFRAVWVSLPPSYRIPELFDDTGDPFYFEAGEERVGSIMMPYVRLAADSHLPFYGSSLRGIARIAYSIRERSDGSLALFRSDHLHPYPDEDAELRFLVCEDVTVFELEFLDSDGRWHRGWDSQSRDYGYGTPRSVRIRLESGSGADKRRMETEVLIPVWRKAQEDL